MTRKQPKRATPKPVEAWAAEYLGRIVMDSISVSKRFVLSYINGNGAVFPVRIVPIVNRKLRAKRKERKK